jgi:hypothetical protein
MNHYSKFQANPIPFERYAKFLIHKFSKNIDPHDPDNDDMYYVVDVCINKQNPAQKHLC